MAGLKIYYSDRIEDLASHLKECLEADRAGGDPFDFPQVVVPNTNIAKWLRMRVFAKTPALCAGVSFPFMEERLSELLSRNLPSGRPFSLLPDNAYANAIMAVLLDADHPEFAQFAPFRAYVCGGNGAQALRLDAQSAARMAWQLATALANLMDAYEVRRPEIVSNWLAGRNADGTGTPAPESAEAGEAALARALWGAGGVFPAGGERMSLRQLYDSVKDSPPAGPSKRIYFFGQSTLSLLQTRILVWLARTHEIVFYHNNVCLEYWGDIETKAERVGKLGKAQAENEDIEIENPLLRQWGIAGRETMRLLVELEEENDGSIDFEWTCVAPPARPRAPTLLGTIQNAICRRTGAPEKMPQDASLQIVGAPGIRREVELVYNAILGSVWKPDGSGGRPWGECSFSDIAVLVPDMAKYRPVIESVFDARGEVPYGLVDTSASEDSKFLAGFLALAALARKGLSRETLFAVLDNPCVQAALGFTPGDVEEWRKTAVQIGAFDGFETRAGESLFNWDWALSRLRLATVFDGGCSAAGREIPPPAGSGGPDLRFSEIVELLYRRVKEVFGRPAAASCWARAFKGLMDDFLAVPGESVLEGSVRRQIFLVLENLDIIPGELDCEFAVAAVEHFVGGISCRKGGYLTHGVTIAGLQPMRPVPFRQVFVLGLGEGGFPGRTGVCSVLDVRGTGWRLGDVTPPKMNRYLFLETLMSVRDRLVITYPNRDIEKDAELFPSGLVRELEDFAGAIVESGAFEEFKNYPLLERGEKNMPDLPDPVGDVVWSPDDPQAGLLPTYSRVARTAAALRRGLSRSPDAEAADAGCAGASGDEADKSPAAVRREVSARELAEFLKSPFSAVLRYRFGIAIEGYRDTELDADSPLGIPDGPVKWDLESAWLENKGDSKTPFRALQLSGCVPAGFLGDFAEKKFDDALGGTRNELLEFVSSFGIGADGTGTFRQNLPATIGRAEKPPIDVRYTCAVPDWRQDGAETSILVTGFLKDRNVKLPPERTLEPFIGFLMYAAGRNQNEGVCKLRMGVVSAGTGVTACWRWEVAPHEAREYLDGLAAAYLEYLETPRTGGGYVDFTCRKLAKSVSEAKRGIDGAIDWQDALGRLTAEEFAAGGGGFDKSLVVEQAVEKFRRAPDASGLERVYAERYQLPFSGIKDEPHESPGEGGAQ